MDPDPSTTAYIYIYGYLAFSISDFEIGGGKKRKKLSKLLGNVTKVGPRLF
jgi:hypothetical protein